MASNIKHIPFALRDGVHILAKNIPYSERGEKCNCSCFFCGEKLIAKIGKGIRIPHFAHTKNAVCHANKSDIEQTHLHIIAKEIIEQEKHLKLPEVIIPFEATPLFQEYDKYKDFHFAPYVLRKSMDVAFDSVRLEERLGKIVPDIIATANGKDCLIEIAVTHSVDDNKKQLIQQLNIPVLEIDLSKNFSKTSPDEEKLKDFLVNDITKKTWINNPLWKSKAEKAVPHYKKQIERHELDIKRAMAEQEKLN